MPHPRVKKTMTPVDIIAVLPQAESVLGEYGLHCFQCSAGAFETLEEGCRSHGFADEAIEELIDDLNALIRDLPVHPASITVTEAAVGALRTIASEQKQKHIRLEVVPDGQGGFCLEFLEKATKEKPVWKDGGKPPVSVFVSPLVMLRVGGAVIDLREGRLKLDLREESCCNDKAKACECYANGDDPPSRLSRTQAHGDVSNNSGTREVR
jgi:hybrid cluster-associated redox disulfide protein